MQDPVKKYENLKFITEGIFNKLGRWMNSSPAAVLPSSQHADNAKAYQKMYGVHYIIKGFSSKNHYDANDLIRMYKSGQIKNDTQIRRVNGKQSYFPFSNFLKREPFASHLKDEINQNTEQEKVNEKHSFAIPTYPAKGNPYYKEAKLTPAQMASFLTKNPNLENLIKVLDSKTNKYIPLKSSAIHTEIINWKSHI